MNIQNIGFLPRYIFNVSVKHFIDNAGGEEWVPISDSFFVISLKII